MKQICELNDRIVLGTEGLSAKAPRITARAIVRNQSGLYAVMYAEKWGLHSLPGGGVEDGEDVRTALRREVYEETGCVCDEIQELGIVSENRASLDYTQINHYFVVTTARTADENHLTEAERDCRTVVKWVAFDELVRLIGQQEFDYLKAKYAKKINKKLTLADYHERLLSLGRVPIRTLDEAMSKEMEEKKTESFFNMTYF